MKRKLMKKPKQVIKSKQGGKSLELQKMEKEKRPSSSGNVLTKIIDKPVRKKKVKKSSMFGWICFTEFNELFNIGKKRALLYSDLNPLAPDFRAKKIRREVKKIVQELADENEDFDELEDVADVIYKMIKPKLMLAIILKGVSSTVSIILAMTIHHFLPEVKKIEGKDPNHKVMLICVAVAAVATLVKSIVDEHYQKYMCQIGAITAQSLRVLLFDKLSNANFCFLKNADTSLLTKLVLFEFGSFNAFINTIPDVFGFPYIFVVSTLAMVHFLTYISVAMFIIFFIAWFLLLCVMKNMAGHTQRQRFFSSKRSLLISEILEKFMCMKYDCMEYFLKSKVKDMRNQEMSSLAAIHYLTGIANFILTLTPLFSILIILSLEHKINKVALDLTTTFTIISLIHGMTAPFQSFIHFIMKYKGYVHAKTCINNFLFVIGNKPSDVERDVNLKLGQIYIDNCTTEIEVDKAMIEVLEGIFGGNVDFQKERKKVRDRMAKRHKKMKEAKKKNGKGDKSTDSGGDEKDFVDKEGFSGKQSKSLLDLKYLLEDNRVEVNFLMDLDIDPTQKVCVSGIEGSGVEEFFYSILGENFISHGSITFNGKVIFCDASNPVFMAGKSLRQNIILGEVYCEERYTSIIKKIGLDITNFAGKDTIEVLNDGINFSAVEKLKILLSRVVYLGGDIFILKDFFGHEESEKEKDLLQVLTHDLLKTKTIMFNSNDEILMENCDKIVVFEQGKLHDMRTYDNFRYLKMLADQVDDGGDVEDIIMKLENDTKNKEENQKNIKMIKKIDHMDSVSGLFEASKNFSNSRILKEKLEKQQNKILKRLNDKKAQNKKGEVQKLTKTWDASDSFKNLSSKLFQYVYIRGKGRIIFQFLLFFFSCVIAICSDIWVGIWSGKYFNLKMEYYMAIYFFLAIFGALFVIIRDRSFTFSLRSNSEAVHTSLIDKVFDMKMNWFTTFPANNIGLRLTNNLKAIDNSVNNNIHAIFEKLGYFIGGMIIVNYVYTGTMLIPTIILLLYLTTVFKTYIQTSTHLIKFIGGNTARMTSVFGMAVQHMINFRAMGKLDILDEGFCEATDELQRSLGHYGFMSKRWLAMRVMIVKTLLIISAYTIPIIIVFYLKGYFHKPLLEFAMAISWSFKSIDNFNAINGCFLNLIGLIINFTVIQNLTENIETETHTEDKRIVAGPMKQFIMELRNVNVSLGGRKILNGVNLKVKNKERLAIVGESGSGKHVLFNTIMKIYERDQLQNSGIKLLGMDLDGVSCEEIRQHICFLKGDPVVFAGTVRENIDPSYSYSDDTIMNVMWRIDAFEIFNTSTANSLANSMVGLSQKIEMRRSRVKSVKFEDEFVEEEEVSFYILILLV